MSRFIKAERVLERALAARAFSAVTAEIGSGTRATWTYAAGRLAFDEAAPVVDHDTIFDLASLTKVVATTTIALQQTSHGVLTLDLRVREVVSDWDGADRRAVTVRDLLEHCSGLPAYRAYFRSLTGAALLCAAAREPLEYTPRTQSIYSDLGFMVLGRLLERLGEDSLAQQFRRWREPAGIQQPLDYTPPPAWQPRTAFTEQDPWRGRTLQGEVHDENAAALGGVAPHAGLFGTASAVGAAARWWLQRLAGQDDPRSSVTASAAQMFARRSAVPGSSRALGWDTMLPTSSCGTRLSARAIGHTGFTGTSLWLDPERDAYFVLLTNRVHPTRTNEAIQQVRRAFHDAAAEDLAVAGQ